MKPYVYLWSLCFVVFAGIIISYGGEGMTGTELLKQADDQFQAAEYGKAMSLYEQTATAAAKDHNNCVLAEAYAQIARCYLLEDSLEQCREWLAKAGELTSDNEPLSWSRYLGVRGRLEWQEAVKESKNYTPVVENAKRTFIDMYDYCMAHELYERAVDAAHMVAIVGDMDTRLAWGEKGIAAAKKGGFEGWLGPLWNNHGWNLQEAGRYQESLEALKKARDYHYKAGRELPKLIADWSVGYAFRMVGDLDSATIWMTDVYDRVQAMYDADSSPDNTEWVGHANREMGEIALARGEKDQALEYFIAAESKLAAVGMPEWDEKGYLELKAKIDSLQTGQ
jgi:tetratricopeptide (TPR) repeat protein